MTSKQKDARPSGSTARIQKLLADAGCGSRRGLEKRIEAGEVRLNDSVASIGATASVNDVLVLDGQKWRVTEKEAAHRSLIYNKPLGEVTTRSDPEGRPTVFDRLPHLQGRRWVAVGRLDINTTGLLLMTTDGELANAMMHPSNQVDREYACRVLGEVDDAMMERLKKGVELDDGPAQFSDIVASGGDGENKWFHVTLLEGRNREVRRLWDSQGVRVSRLKRVRYGAAFMPRRLRMGEHSELSSKDHTVLREDVKLPPSPTQLQLRPLGKPPRQKYKQKRSQSRRKAPTRHARHKRT